MLMSESLKDSQNVPAKSKLPLFLPKNWKKAFKNTGGCYKSYQFYHNLPSVVDAQNLPANTENQPAEQETKSGLTKIIVPELKCVFCKGTFDFSAALLLHYICVHIRYAFYHKVSLFGLY